LVADPRVLRRGSAFSSHLPRNPIRRSSQRAPSTHSVEGPSPVLEEKRL
jgi:hypothetical protein